jgi:hypothetical protein
MPWRWLRGFWGKPARYLDKTGTLTLGEFRVVDLAVADGIGEDEALRIAANRVSDEVLRSSIASGHSGDQMVTSNPAGAEGSGTDRSPGWIRTTTCGITLFGLHVSVSDRQALR